MSILIKDVWIVSQDALRRQFKGSVYVEDEVIREVKQESIAVEAEYKINGEGKVLLPGLINAHTHIPMTLLRGYEDDMVLEEWLRTRIWPVEAKLDRESISAGTDLGLLEMILSGTTCFADMYFFEDTIAERTIKAGLRGFLG
ncbi:MAG TPA: metal-dependent hydrolase, partial [Thermoplasmatales archaeon]|nr:metal-dependent hydrolase [Thermoplasmatales archaeon]